MIDKMNPLYFKGVRPIPVIPTVYTDALSYGEQLGIIGHKTDECVEKVNEVVDDNNTFKAELTTQQNTFESEITEQQNTFETNITNQQSSFETAITNQQNTYEQETTSGLTTWKTNTKAEFKEQIDGMQEDYQKFLDEYERTYGVSQTLGDSSLNVISQAGTTKAINTRASLTDLAFIGDTTDVPLSDIVIDRNGWAYTAPNGYAELTGWNTIKIHIPTCMSVSVTNVASGIAVTHFDGTTNRNVASSIGGGRYIQSNTDLYISYNVDISNVHVVFKKWSSKLEYPRYYYTEGKINPGVAGGNGTVTYLSNGANCVQKIPVNGLTIKHDNNDYNINACAFDADDNYLGAVTKIGGRILVYPYGTAYIMMTTGQENIIYYDLSTAVLEKKYYKKSIVDKPFTFANSNILALGDSIMLGYYGGATHSNDAFIKLFADKVGAYNLNNVAVGGATYATVSGTTSIITEAQGVTFNAYDYIFILAGTNDYGRAVPISDLETALTTLSNYINANKKSSAKVFIITPLDRTSASDEPTAPLDEYRNSITLWALVNNYNLINGEDLGITDVNTTYINTVTADGLHPNQKGHQIIASALCGYLL